MCYCLLVIWIRGPSLLCSFKVFNCGVFPATVPFLRCQAPRLRRVAVDDYRSINDVRGGERVLFNGVRRTLRRVHRLFFENLPITNSNRLCFRQNVFDGEGVATRHDHRHCSLDASRLRRQLRIFPRGEDFGHRFVKRMAFSGAGRPFISVAGFRMVVTRLPRVSSPRDSRLKSYPTGARRSMSRSHDAKVGTRGGLFFCQLGRSGASVGIKGPAALSLGVFADS